jgi:hypothetical protein
LTSNETPRRISRRPDALRMSRASDGDPVHGLIFAYWVSKSSGRISPIWIPRRTPSASMKYVWGGATTR